MPSANPIRSDRDAGFAQAAKSNAPADESHNPFQDAMKIIDDEDAKQSTNIDVDGVDQSAKAVS